MKFLASGAQRKDRKILRSGGPIASDVPGTYLQYQLELGLLTITSAVDTFPPSSFVARI